LEKTETKHEVGSRGDGARAAARRHTALVLLSAGTYEQVVVLAVHAHVLLDWVRSGRI
jgi:hypothetical protein